MDRWEVVKVLELMGPDGHNCEWKLQKGLSWIGKRVKKIWDARVCGVGGWAKRKSEKRPGLGQTESMTSAHYLEAYKMRGDTHAKVHAQ